MRFRLSRFFLAYMLFIITGPAIALAQSSPTINLNAKDLIPRAAIFISPTTQTVIQGSTFNVSIYLNTEQNSANTLDLKLQFPPNKLAIVSPSGGTSLIQIWLQPPAYSNTDGTAEFSGVIPNGIVTQSGLITTITFKALAPGDAKITISPDSTILANDGQGTQMNAEFENADYTIEPQPPGGVTVSSPTHPFPSAWYNNSSPVFDWQQDPGVDTWSYVLDNDPYTVPGDTPTTTSTERSYQNLGDGLWYFHIKALKLGVWGSTTNFLVQIDTQPPAAFTPIAEVVAGNNENKILISFFTTDALSGVNHYEVAVIDDDGPAVASPVFVQTESPYQLNVPGPGHYHVIVRAVDGAGNIRDASIDVTVSVPFIQFLKNNDLMLILGLLLLILLLIIIHYFFGHKLLRRAQKAILAAEHEDHLEKLKEAEELIEQEKQPE